jgi:two-component system chemotaxis response regulator CheB
VLAASAGGVTAVRHLLSTLPADLPVPIVLVQHRSAKLPFLLADVLARRTALTVKNVVEGERLQAGTVYVAPPDQHLRITMDHTVALSDGHRVRHVLSSANPLFSSVADVFHNRVIAVVLTGWGADATDGVQAVSQAGGVVIAQDQASAEQFAMPRSAIQTGCVDYILSLDEIGPVLLQLLKTGQKSG